MAAVSAVNPKLNFPLCPGGSVDVYLAGTTSRSNTWQDRNQTTLNTNPIILDARGECVAWLDSAKRYKFVVKNAAGVTIYTVDNVAGAQPGAASVAQFTTDTFSGDASETEFTLSVTPSHENATNVFVGGTYQQKSAYGISGTTLTFNVAPVLGTNNVEVVTASILDYTDVAADIAASLAAADASEAAAANSETNAAASAVASAASAAASAASAAAAAISEAQAAAIVLGDFLQDGTDPVARTYPDKLRETVSLTDFEGADSTGATSSSTALTNALATGARVLLPPGAFLFNTKVALPSGFCIVGAGVEATTIRSGVIGDSLFYTTASATGFGYMSDMTIDGNGLSGASGNGHAINFIDPTIDGASHSPQFCTLERLYIRDFKGNDVVPGSASTFEACGIVQADGLQNVYRDVIVQNCGHGFYLYRAQNTKLINCAADSITKAALIAYDCENVIVDHCDFVDAADGVASTNYPTTFGSAIVISCQNEGFVLSNCKLKNTNGGRVINSILSNNDVIEKNWLRADSLTDNVHKCIYAERSSGIRILNNTFAPANSGFTSRKYQQIELYNTQTAEFFSATIEGNTFGDVSGMNIEYNIRLTGSATTRSFGPVVIRGNQFGYRDQRSSACVVDADITFDTCTVYGLVAERNLHYAPSNVTRTAGVLVPITATLFNAQFGPSVFQANGGTITANYSGCAASDAVSSDKGDASATITTLSERASVWNTPLTSNRSVSLSTVGAANGARRRIVRTAASTGAFTLSVGTGPLKALAAGQWCEVEFDGSAWVLTAFGSL
jgi:hypothetical protein